MAALAQLLIGVACGPAPPSPERQALTNFFRASRLRDTTVLARGAAVVFEPRTDGVVRAFEIADAGQERPAANGRIVKQVTIDARVRTPAGQLAARTLAVTMERAAGERRWFVTAFTPLPASRTSPAASSGPPR